ncbi:hypothetical protein G7Y89_g4397 [Cudoniella acicularis]|uniref:SH3 domain-containing protein n=1 Tax=Cudoniella acicularis TaxID=354080 RepID=A0A8H4W7H7_9HELO|nr:hypothetical protein G7Y89_g4397 [Cudoniella acicularis]
MVAAAKANHPELQRCMTYLGNRSLAPFTSSSQNPEANIQSSGPTRTPLTHPGNLPETIDGASPTWSSISRQSIRNFTDLKRISLPITKSEVFKSKRDEYNPWTVHGLILWNVKAQRPDELECKAGDQVLIGAYIGDEWVVAKHLNGFGLGLLPFPFLKATSLSTGEVLKDMKGLRELGIPTDKVWMECKLS